MSRHSFPPRRHSAWLWRLLLLALALPGAIALALLLLTEPAGRAVLVGMIGLSALLAIACGAAMTGRLAAALYNFASRWAGQSHLEKIMRESHDAARARNLSPHKPA